ncbi:glucosyltransferase domain-containing protein [Enterobacter ludwigii]|uniref:glucosyltransferase domain-containing protein n=1 Tax=Enterobacter ludwigii TaxID=299767 RepID=UPI003D17D1ED
MYNSHAFKFALVLSALFCAPFIVANMYFVDDIARAMNGYSALSPLGRPLADVILHSLNFNAERIADIAPLTQIVCAPVLAIAVYFAAKGIFGTVGIKEVLIASPVAINPFFIQNLAYKFDSLPMSTGVMCVCVGFYLCTTRKGTNLVGSAILLISALCLYQPVTNTFFGLVACYIASMAYGKESVKQILIESAKSAAVFVVSYAIYLKFILPVFSLTERGELVSLDAEGFSLAVHNLMQIWFLSGYFVNSFTIYIFKAAIALSIISLAFLIYLHKESHVQWVVRVLLVAVASLAALLSICGPTFLLEVFTPFPRILSGTGALVSFVLLIAFYPLSALDGINQRASFLAAFAAIPVVYTISMSYAFVNAQRAQQAYESSIVNEISSDLKSENKRYAYFYGDAELSPYTKNNIAAFPLIARIISPMYDWTTALTLQSKGVRDVYLNREISNEAMKKVCYGEFKPELVGDVSKVKIGRDVVYFISPITCK